MLQTRNHPRTHKRRQGGPKKHTGPMRLTDLHPMGLIAIFHSGFPRMGVRCGLWIRVPLFLRQAAWRLERQFWAMGFWTQEEALGGCHTTSNRRSDCCDGIDRVRGAFKRVLLSIEDCGHLTSHHGQGEQTWERVQLPRS